MHILFFISGTCGTSKVLPEMLSLFEIDSQIRCTSVTLILLQLHVHDESLYEFTLDRRKNSAILILRRKKKFKSHCRRFFHRSTMH